MRVTNGIPLGWSLLLPIVIVNYVETLKAVVLFCMGCVIMPVALTFIIKNQIGGLVERPRHAMLVRRLQF